MNKRFQFIMLCLCALGLIIFSLSSLLRNILSPFLLGFGEGLSFVLIISWGIYMICSFIHRKNPYKLN